MKQYKSILFWVIFLSIFLVGCSHKNIGIGFLSNNDKIDPSLPTISEMRILSDVTSIAFEWDLIQNPNLIKGFVLYQANPNGNAKKIATIKNSYSTHFVLDSLIPDTEYSFFIATIGLDNAVSQKSQAFKTKTSFIDPIEKAYASKENAKSIKLIWSPHPNPSITKYIIQRASDNGKFVNIATIKNRLLVEYFDENLSDGKEYSYRIIAQDFNGAKSLPSEVIIGQTRNKPKTIQSVQASTNLPKDIQLNWEAVPDVSKYEIYFSETLEGNYRPLVKVNKNFYTDKIGKDNVVRFYKVVAIDDNDIIGELPNGAARGNTLPPPPTPIITKGSIQKGYAYIEWEVINDERVKAYAVYRYEGGKSTQPLRFANTIKNTFTDKEMQKGKRYIYKVVSVDANGNESESSSEVELLLK